MALGDVFQVKLKSTYQEEDCLNVFYYEYFAGTDGTFAESISLLFKQEVLAPLKELVNTDVLFTSIEVTRLANPSDYYMDDFELGTGLRVINVGPAPAFIAMSFYSSRPYPGTRSARKRFSGFNLGDINGDKWLSALLSSQIVSDVNLALAAVLTSGQWSFRPVVVKHPTPLGQNPLIRYVTQTWFAASSVSTQNSRKDS